MYQLCRFPAAALAWEAPPRTPLARAGSASALRTGRTALSREGGLNFAPSAFPRSRDLPDFVPRGCCNLWGAREGPFTPPHTPGLGRVWDRDTQDIIWDSSRCHMCTLAPRHRHCNSSPRVGAAQATTKTPPGCLGNQLLDPVGFPCDGLRSSPQSGGASSQVGSTGCGQGCITPLLGCLLG